MVDVEEDGSLRGVEDGVRVLGELEGQPRLLEGLAAVGYVGHVEVDLVLVVLVDHGDEEEAVEEEEAVAARQQHVVGLPQVVRAHEVSLGAPHAEGLVALFLLVGDEEHRLLLHARLEHAVQRRAPVELRDVRGHRLPHLAEVDREVDLHRAVDALSRLVAAVGEVRSHHPVGFGGVHLELLDGEGRLERHVVVALVKGDPVLLARAAEEDLLRVDRARVHREDARLAFLLRAGLLHLPVLLLPVLSLILAPVHEVLRRPHEDSLLLLADPLDIGNRAVNLRLGDGHVGGGLARGRVGRGRGLSRGERKAH
mmetsp:Transcript_24237/g.57980  ORF Transcript_24237/g.57980 Transcript_24237/m.57980 type:complete len:311 (-) Transcript_24237:66-998(-)